jgi:alcohol dehydrogenase YqhD (iron-dependent ADH family)
MQPREATSRQAVAEVVVVPPGGEEEDKKKSADLKKEKKRVGPTQDFPIFSVLFMVNQYVVPQNVL